MEDRRLELGAGDWELGNGGDDTSPLIPLPGRGGEGGVLCRFLLSDFWISAFALIFLHSLPPPTKQKTTSCSCSPPSPPWGEGRLPGHSSLAKAGGEVLSSFFFPLPT